MEAQIERQVPRAQQVWIVLVVAIVLLSVFAVWKSARMSGAMSVAAAAEQKFLQTAAGTNSKVVVEVAESTPEGTIRGKLLEKKTEKIYARTTTGITVRFDAQTKFVMGTKSDIRPGAVLHATGTIREDRSIQAEQLVILSGYVQVQ